MNRNYLRRLFGRKVQPVVPAPKVSEPVEGKLEDLVMQTYINAGARGLTADECADRLGRGILSVRPTVTRLFQTERLRRTGEKRMNHSGLRANVLVVA